MFLAKLFETCKLSGGWGVWLLQHVNYVTPHFFNKNNVNNVDFQNCKTFMLYTKTFHSLQIFMFIKVYGILLYHFKKAS